MNGKCLPSTLFNRHRSNSHIRMQRPLLTAYCAATLVLLIPKTLASETICGGIAGSDFLLTTSVHNSLFCLGFM